jgi:micrococcal nuclease
MYEYRCKVIRVVDGDTVELEIDLGLRITTTAMIRLFGIDTPEVRFDRKRPNDKALGIAAAQRLREMVVAGAPLTVLTERDMTGKYGRYLGTLVSGSGVSLNDQLVTEGHASRVTY